MTDNLLFRIYETQLRTLKETVEAWKAEHQEATPDGEVQELVQFTLHLPNATARLWDATFNRMRDGRIDDYYETGHTLQGIFDRTIEVLQDTRQWARAMESAGRTIRGAQELEDAIAQVQRLKDQIFEHWPWFTEKDIEEARAAHARGECEELDDAFALIAGVDKETWLKRMHEYRRTRE